MNKKFFAALASATMAFTASGSIAVFADDFVEEKTPVVDGNVTPLPETVVWNEDNFGALVNEEGTVFTGTELSGGLQSADNKKLEKDVKVKTADLAKVETITLTAKTNAEIKGLEYFTGLKTFSDGAATETNTALDFSANTKLTSLTVKNAKDLAEIVLPEAFVNENEKEVYSLATLDLQGTKLTTLDLSKQAGLKDLTVKKSSLGKLDLSALTLDKATVTGNYNLAEVTLNNGKPGNRTNLNELDLSDNSLETINLDYIHIKKDGKLDLSGNHFGALDLSKTTSHSNATITLGTQEFYVSHKFGSVNLAETFENFNVEKVTNPTDSKKYNKETGVLTLDSDTTQYTYKVNLDGKSADLTVKLVKANPMNRLYNPNSGEHFYTADLEEKDALVKLGWQDEGYGWVAPKDKTGADKDVYRLYNPNAGDHHYTTNSEEVKTLVAYGWKDEGKGWISAEDNSRNGKTVPVYRQYNPFANGAGSHNYTTDKAENDYLVSLGWTPEGTAWYGLK